MLDPLRNQSFMCVMSLALAAIAGCAEGRSNVVEGELPDDSDAAMVVSADATPRYDADPGAPDAGLAIDAAPAPDASATAPDAGACTEVVTNLLTNPAFDSGPGGGWSETSSGGFAVIMPDSDPLLAAIDADSPPYLAWLGGAISLDDSLGQTVTVPVDASALRVRGRRWIASNETLNFDYDDLTVTLRSSTGAVLQEVGRFSNLDTTVGWTSFDLPAAAPHAGATVRLELAAHNDFSEITNFFLDGLALEVTTPCP